MSERIKNFRMNFSATLSSVKEHAACFLLWPKDYIYLLSYSTQEKVHICAYNPKMADTMNILKNMLQKSGLDMPIHFIGSAALGIAGQNDIDIFVECLPQDFDKYIPIITKLFGHEQKQHDNFVEWVFMRGGYEVELVLIDPLSVKFHNQMSHFDIMRGDNAVLHEYETLKLLANGVSKREYETRKLLFFYRIHSIQNKK